MDPVDYIYLRLLVFCSEGVYLEPGVGIRTPWWRMAPVEYIYLRLLVLCSEDVYLEPRVGVRSPSTKMDPEDGPGKIHILATAGFMQ